MSDTSTQTGTERQPLGAELILPLLASGLTIYYLIDTATLAWEARATGVIIGVVLLALCAVQVVRTTVRLLTGTGSLSFGAFAADTLDNRRRLGLLVLSALFIFTIEYVGTTLGLFLFLYAAMWTMGVRSQTQLLAISFCTAATVYGLLVLLLGSRLPRGVVEKGLAMLGIGAS